MGAWGVKLWSYLWEEYCQTHVTHTPITCWQRLMLEVTTMREKYEGWKEEVERLMPLEEEVKRLGKENEELAQQVTLMVEEGEQQREAQGARNEGRIMDYDTMMKRLTELQDTRVTMEEELCQLREERASILKENADLHEGSQPQNYTNLKQKYERIVSVLRATELAVSEEKQANSELQSVNLELHQRLVSATDPEKLKSIQERMVRYKNERDTAKSELEDVQARLITVEIDAKSAQDAFLSNPTSKEEELQLHLEIKDTEIEKLTLSAQTYQSRMLAYRDERNRYRDYTKSLKQQLRLLQESLNPPITPKLEGAEVGEDVEMETEVSSSPSHDPHNQYGSPTLDYAPEQYATESSHHHHREDCSTPSDGPVSPTTSKNWSKASVEVYTPAKPKGNSCMYRTVQVRTKGGRVVEMDIQKPSTQLNPRQKPQVVVKRDSGYETGTLMYVGNIGGKDTAGVVLDLRNMQSKYYVQWNHARDYRACLLSEVKKVKH